MNYSRAFANLILLAALIGYGPTLAAQSYGVPKPPTTVVILPTPPSAQDCDAWDVNEAGTIVGACVAVEDPSRFIPLRWTPAIDGSYLEEMLAGAAVLEDTGDPVTLLGGLATGINESGEIAGQLQIDVAGFPRTRAAVWREGTWFVLRLQAGAVNGAARDIDDYGRVVGTAGSRAVVWSAGSVTVLPTLDAGFFCVALATNNIGEVVGQCDYEQFGHRVPVTWRNGVIFELPNQRLPVGESPSDYARTINNNGLIGGTASQAAYVWNTNKADAAKLVASVGIVNSINDRDVLVGILGNPNSWSRAAWWRNPSKSPVLFAPDFLSSFARAINNAGVVVGTLVTYEDVKFAFVAF